MSRMPLRSHRWGQFSCTPGERVTTCSCIKVGPSSVVAIGPSAVWTVVISISSYRVHTSSTGLSPSTAASTTDSIAGSLRRRPAVSRAGSRSARVSALSASSARRRALDQLLGARLDPREEARHHHTHAQARVALDVADVDERAGHAAGLDDLLDRAVDGLLDFRVPHIADLAHRGRQVAGRHEEAVDVVDLEDLVEAAHGHDVLDQDDHEALVVGGLQIAVDAEALAARVHAALAEWRELAGRDDRLGLGAVVDVRHHDPLGAAIERAIDRGVVVVPHADDRRLPPEVAGARQVAELAVVDAAVLALEPDAVDVERAELIDQVRFVGAGDDRRDLAGGELLLHAIRSDVHGASSSGF